MKGKFIVLEGADGSGKSTQAKLLHLYLKKRKIKSVLIFFPSYKSHWGNLIRKYLNGDFGKLSETDPYLISAIFAADRLFVKDKINSLLENGYFVICDRYVASNVAHQAAKFGNISRRDNFIKWAVDFEYQKNKIPKEDYVIYLSVPVIVSQKLMELKTKDIHESNVGYLNNVYGVYEKLAQENKNWLKVVSFNNDIMADKSEVHKQVIFELQNKKLI